MAPKHILVVGSPMEDVKNINYLLEVSGCRVTLVRDVREAVDSLVLKKLTFHKLDLILINDFSSLVQFIDVFNGPVRLRESYPIIVFDKFNMRDRFHEMFQSIMDDFNIRVCDSEHYLAEIEKTLELDFRAAVFH